MTRAMAVHLLSGHLSAADGTFAVAHPQAEHRARSVGGDAAVTAGTRDHGKIEDVTDSGLGYAKPKQPAENEPSGPDTDPSPTVGAPVGADLARLPRWASRGGTHGARVDRSASAKAPCSPLWRELGASPGGAPGTGGERDEEAPGILADLVHPRVESAIAAARGGGRPLEQSTRQRLEHLLGASLGEVRVHDNDRAGDLADAVSARAFTVGHDLFFGAGAYRPGSSDGDRLLAHEATHALQQGSAPGTGPLRVSAPVDAHEVEAEAVAAATTHSTVETPPAQTAGGPAGAPADGRTGHLARHEAGTWSLREAPGSLLQRQGWSGARTGGWNEMARTIGGTLRIPIDGIRGGNQAAAPNPATHESAAGRAIVIVPPSSNLAGGETEVLLFFHGMNLGYRERAVAGGPGAAGTVRDVEADQIEQQLEHAGRNMVGVLAQGTVNATFGITGARRYVDEVLGLFLPRLRAIRPNRSLPSSLHAGRIVVGGHSGGGRAATAAAASLEAHTSDVDAWVHSAPLFLFDAINSPEEGNTIWAMVERWLNDDLAQLTKPGANAPQLLALRGIKLRSTWGAGSDPRYKKMNVGKHYDPVTDRGLDPLSLKGRLRSWFGAHSAALGPARPGLRAQYRVEGVVGTHEFTVGTGGPPTHHGVAVSPGLTAPSGPGAPDYAGGGNLETSITALPTSPVPAGLSGGVLQRQVQRARPSRQESDTPPSGGRLRTSTSGRRSGAQKPGAAALGAGELGRRLQRQLLTRPSRATVGMPPADNFREDVLAVMDRLHFVGVLSDADYALEHGPVVAKAPGAAIAQADIPKTVAAISANEVDYLPAWVAEKMLALRLGGDVGPGRQNDRADVARLQLRLRALNLLLDADFAAESVAGRSGPITDAAIARTRAAIKSLRLFYASGTLGWQPVRLGDWRQPDESLFGGDRFGGQTFDFAATLPTFDPATDPPGSAVDRPEPLSIFVPTKISAPPPGQPAATSTKVAVFFSPGDVTGSWQSNAVLVHGLRAAAEGGDRVLISVFGISGTRGDGWAAITNAAITACLDRAGLPTALGTVRLISHSRGAGGLKQTLLRRTLTATVDKIIVLDESTTFGAGGGNLEPFIRGAAPARAGDPGITMAPGGGGVSYQVVALPLAGTTQTPKINEACARAIGYSRLIKDAVTEKASVVQDLFGPAPAAPTVASPDWTGIWPQVLNLPPRGQFSTQTPTPAGMTDIYGFCRTNARAIAAMEANVAAELAEEKKPRASWNVNIIQKSPRAFCEVHNLGIGNLGLRIDAHHYFVAEIAHELF